MFNCQQITVKHRLVILSFLQINSVQTATLKINTGKSVSLLHVRNITRKKLGNVMNDELEWCNRVEVHHKLKYLVDILF